MDLPLLFELLLVLAFLVIMCAAWCTACAVGVACAVGGAATQVAQRPVSPRTILWPSAGPASSRIATLGRTIARAAMRRGEFGPPSPRAAADIRRAAAEVAAAESAADSAAATPADEKKARDALTSVYQTEVTLAAQRIRPRATDLPDGLLTADDIIAAAQQRRVPAAALLAVARAAEQVAKGDFAAVYEADLSSRVHQMRVQAAAAAFEDAVAARLTELGAGAYQREDEIRAAAIAAGTTAPLTPDFLFKEPILLNGQLIYWLDAKNYYWYGSPLTARSVARQAEKYTHAFGPGAFVFRYGADPAAPVGAGAGAIPPLILM